jgi:hypothetical protein
LADKFKMNKMRKKLNYTILILFSILVLGFSSSSQIPDEIINSLKTGNSTKLASYFNQNVELVVLENESVCSKSQAEQVINDFFSKYPPQKFTIIHQGGKGDSNYAIGNLETQNGRFRVYFLIKTINQVSFIHQLRIELQSE